MGWGNNHASVRDRQGAIHHGLDPGLSSAIRDAGVPYAITNFPGGGYPFAGTQGFFINAQSENVLLAQAFLNEYIANEDTMLKLYKVGQRPPAYLPALAKIEDKDLQAMAKAGEKATMMPAIPEMGSVWGNWNDSVVLARDGKQDAETAMKEGGTKNPRYYREPADRHGQCRGFLPGTGWMFRRLAA